MLLVALCALCAGTTHAQIQPSVFFEPHDALIGAGSFLDASLTVSIADGEYVDTIHREYGYTLLGVTGRIFSGDGEELALPPLLPGATFYRFQTSFHYADSGFYTVGSDGFVTYGWWNQSFLGDAPPPFFVTTNYPFNQYYEVEVLEPGGGGANLPVPEPQTSALLLAGLGLLALTALRRAGKQTI